MTSLPKNTDPATVEGFGREWATFTQSAEAFTDADRRAMFEGYFAIFPWDRLPPNSVGADIGCGSGRWTMLVAPRVGHLHAIDPAADALAVARANLAGLGNVSFHQASVSALPFADGSLDFAYALGVLHHVPDTAQAIRDAAAKLKPGAPFLLYLYYALDNRSAGYRMLWKISNTGRLILRARPTRCRSPQRRSSPIRSIGRSRAWPRCWKSSACCRAPGHSPITATARST